MSEIPRGETGYRELHSTFEDLEQLIEPHLDAFSRGGLGHGGVDRYALIELFCRRRRDFELAVLVISSRAGAMPVRTQYPMNLLAKLCDDVLIGPTNGHLNTLHLRIAQLEPELVLRLRAAVANLAGLDSRSRWREWPSAALARALSEVLEQLGPAWDRACSELCYRYRGNANHSKRRDPSFRRAIHWRAILLGLLHRLMTKGAAARLNVDYCFTILSHFDTKVVREPSTQSPNKAICDLLVLEVFGLLEQFVLADGTAAGASPSFLEQGDYKRRKRIQRARLQVVLNWKPLVADSVWADFVYPTLLRISEGVEEQGQREPPPAK